MKISTYTYNQYTGILTLYGIYGETLDVRITQDSGKIVYREKISSPARLPHPGILVGTDIFGHGIEYILHNHYQNGCAEIEDHFAYSKGQIINRYYKTCSFDRIEVLNRGLQSAARRERYHWLDYNCQTYINEACQAQRYSESVNNYKNGLGTALGISAIFLLIGALASGGK